MPLNLLKNKANIILIAVLILAVYSCRDKNESIDYNKNLRAGIDVAKGERLFFDIFTLIYKSSYDATLLSGGTLLKDGAVIRYFETPERKYFVSYGDYYRNCPDGLSRKGYYNVYLTDNFLTPNNTATVEFINYYVQEYQIRGKITITNLGSNPYGGFSFTYNIDTGLIANYNDSIRTTYIHWESNQHINSFGNDSTVILGLMGSVNGISHEGISFSTFVLDSLIKNYQCNWFIRGSQRLNTPSLDAKSGNIDYTKDSCSNRVYFIYDGIKLYDDIKIY